jgi:putative methionine-R-sulfoxide reductase with GAF domain
MLRWLRTRRKTLVDRRKSSEKERHERWRAYLPVAQILLAAGGLLGAIFHAFPIHQAAKLKQNWPVLDAVDIAWLAMIAVAALLPGISKLTLGGVSLEMKEEARESKEELEVAIEDYANLAQNWSTAAILYIYMMSNANDDDERAMLLSHYLRDRMGEAKAYLSEEPTDDVHIALWIYEPAKKELEFFFSNEKAPTRRSYALGEGMIGQSFLERRRFNEPDVRTVPSYISTRGGEDPPYRAVLCVPVLVGDEAIGIITANKKSAEIFSDAADDIAKGLASQCALAIDQFRKAG